MSKRNIKLLLSYDGTDFRGFQRQPRDRSVQEELEKALAKMHGHPVPTVGAGRTDSGVHALGQVANFYTDIRSIPAEKFVLALNKLLPRDLRVLKAEEADFDFHSRYDARLRRYRYFCACGPAVDPFRLRYAHHLPRIPDLARLNALAAPLLGERDFTAFSSAKDASLSRFRFVHEASFRWEGGLLVFQVAANAFLWRMVRSLVGSLLLFEAEGRDPSHVEGLLASGARAEAGPTAPARGLFFWEVEYYPSPTRPGRGAYWAERGPQAGEGAEEPAEDALGTVPPSGPGSADGKPAATVAATAPADNNAKRRLVPGLGYTEE